MLHCSSSIKCTCLEKAGSRTFIEVKCFDFNSNMSFGVFGQSVRTVIGGQVWVTSNSDVSRVNSVKTRVEV